MQDLPHGYTHETLEVDVDHFTAQYAMALKGALPDDEEMEILEVAATCMSSDDLDNSTREFFQSAFFVLNKKNKSFIDLRKMKKMLRSGELSGL